jgi:hypothetical protein
VLADADAFTLLALVLLPSVLANATSAAVLAPTFLPSMLAKVREATLTANRFSFAVLFAQLTSDPAILAPASPPSMVANPTAATEYALALTLLSMRTHHVVLLNTIS